MIRQGLWFWCCPQGGAFRPGNTRHSFKLGDGCPIALETALFLVRRSVHLNGQSPIAARPSVLLFWFLSFRQVEVPGAAESCANQLERRGAVRRELRLARGELQLISLARQRSDAQ